jgi:uncharacterized protein YjbI with pentapeptide repeats
MSNTDGTCEYVLDPDDPETWGGEEGDECYVDEDVLNESGVWKCPRDVEENENLCMFHLPPEKSKDTLTKLFTKVNHSWEGGATEHSGHKDSLCFIGARFGSKNINLNELDAAWHKSFDPMRYHDDGPDRRFYSLSSHVYDKPIDLRHSRFEGEVDWSDVIIKHPMRFDGAKFFEDVNMGAEFKKDVSFRGIIVGGKIDFRDSNISENIEFSRVCINGKIDLSELSLIGVSFNNSHIQEGMFWKSDLSNATFTDSSLNRVSFERAILTQADFFGADLRGVAFYGADFRSLQIDEQTEFGERCVYDPKFTGNFTATFDENGETSQLTKAAGQYRIIEQLALTNAFPDMVSHNFIRRQDIQREKYLENGMRLRWLRATASKYVLKYGEGPWNIIVSSLGIILSFAFLYPLGGWVRPVDGEPITYSAIAEDPTLLGETLYYSTLTFTTLGLGDYRPVGAGQYLTTVNTTLGAVLIALLVFVLGRRAAR